MSELWRAHTCVFATRHAPPFLSHAPCGVRRHGLLRAGGTGLRCKMLHHVISPRAYTGVFARVQSTSLRVSSRVDGRFDVVALVQSVGDEPRDVGPNRKAISINLMDGSGYVYAATGRRGEVQLGCRASGSSSSFLCRVPCGFCPGVRCILSGGAHPAVQDLLLH